MYFKVSFLHGEPIFFYYPNAVSLLDMVLYLIFTGRFDGVVGIHEYNGVPASAICITVPNGDNAEGK